MWGTIVVGDVHMRKEGGRSGGGDGTGALAGKSLLAGGVLSTSCYSHFRQLLLLPPQTRIGRDARFCKKRRFDGRGGCRYRRALAMTGAGRSMSCTTGVSTTR